MAIRVFQVAKSELVASRKNILRMAVARIVAGGVKPEEGVGDLVKPAEIQSLVTAWRALVVEHGGDASALAGEIFTPSEGATLRDVATTLAQRADKAVAQPGDILAVKMVDRLVTQQAITYRNTAHPHLGAKDPNAAARVAESVHDGLPPIKAPTMAATAETLGWLADYLQKLGG